MLLFKRAGALHDYLLKLNASGLSTGFVPTMGALHEGHISLIREAKRRNDRCICSIYVNPAQFNDPADFDKYPITTTADIRMLEASGCDILFLPDTAEMYPPSFQPQPHYELGSLETVLEGKFRPGHFQGVCKVIHRLLQITSPSSFYLGQKDYQQCMVVKKLIALLGLSGRMELVIVPTMREPDGLAMSSRNVRLTPDQRKNAVKIHEVLLMISEGLNHQPSPLLIERATALLEANGFRVDYVAIAHADDLSATQEDEPSSPAVALIAAFLGDVRLIDNMLVGSQSYKHS